MSFPNRKGALEMFTKEEIRAFHAAKKALGLPPNATPGLVIGKINILYQRPNDFEHGRVLLIDFFNEIKRARRLEKAAIKEIEHKAKIARKGKPISRKKVLKTRQEGYRAFQLGIDIDLHGYKPYEKCLINNFKRGWRKARKEMEKGD
jgi:hypothetical protein